MRTLVLLLFALPAWAGEFPVCDKPRTDAVPFAQFVALFRHCLGAK